MIANIQYKESEYQIDLSKPLDISIPLRPTEDNVSAWYVGVPTFKPVITEHFVGDVNQGGSVNFRNVFFNPHGNGTHTECVGHISKEYFTINENLRQFFFLSNLISITPENIGDDSVITLEAVKKEWKNNGAKAIVIRTLPNDPVKLSKQYSNTNPTYIDYKAVQFIVDQGVDHLLIDTPSVDRENDGGVLKAHHTFWDYPNNPQMHRTITELVYVPNDIKDGLYFLNLQIASFENDASPSKPLLFEIFS